MSMGTRGDVQPMLALALALRERGHAVNLAAPDNFQSWIEGYGLEFHALGFDMEAFLNTPDVKRAMRSWSRLGKIWRRQVLPVMEDMFLAIGRAAQGAEIVIAHPKAMGARDAAEAQKARYIRANPIPLTPTREFPVPIITRDLGPTLNRMSYQLFCVARLPYLKLLNRWRQEHLGLGPGPLWADSGAGLETLCSVSPSVVPEPIDWAANQTMTGYWELDDSQGFEPDPKLLHFLEQGPAPVYIGFGSMTSAEPDELVEQVERAVKAAGLRAVVASGWGGLAYSGPSQHLFGIEAVPHKWLFPRCSAVVHHGGAGTTAAGLRAGKPTLICPHIADQPFWGKRIHDLGCGPQPLDLKERDLSRRLAQRLRDLTFNPGYRERAAELAHRLSLENGIERAVELIESPR